MAEQVLLCGPSGSGKTEAAVSEYVEQVRARGEDCSLLLLPTRLACDRLRQRVVAEGLLPAVFDPRILTFPDLGDLILHANHEAVAQISNWQRQLLTRWVVAELGEEGRLEALGPLSDYPGFIGSLCQLIDELKRAAVDPPAFARRIAASHVNDARSAELAAIYERYQQALQRQNVYDEAGRFWWARDVLAEGRRRPFEDLRLILVDGFDDFTTTQLQVLKLLADGADRLVVTLCVEHDGSRAELFRSPGWTLQRLKATFPQADEQWLPAASATGPLAALRQGLFAEGRTDANEDPVESLEVIEASGRRAEVQQIAHRVKTLLSCGGVPPDQIAVVARDLTGYSRALVEVFGEAGIPLHVAAPEPVGVRPPVQAALDVLRVPVQVYRLADVLRLLKSNYLDLSAVCEQDPIDPDEVERLASAANILGGRDQWAQRLQVYRSRIEGELETRREGERDEDEQWFRQSADELRADSELAERAQVLLGGLFSRLAALDAVATPAEFVEKLMALLEDLGILARIGQVDRGPIAAANIRAFHGFLEGLRELWATERQLGISRRTDLGEFYRNVLRMSQIVTYQRHTRPQGSVLAVGAAEARQLDFRHVFVLGLCEGEFPRRHREDALFSDQERRQLEQAGIPLEPRVDDQYRDAFLFYSVATAARERLYLSYPTVDAEGREVIRSHYVDEVERCFSCGLPVRRYGLADLVPEFDEITSQRELMERSLFELFGRDTVIGGERRTDLGRSGLNVLAACDHHLLANVLATVSVEDRRDSLDPPDEYDGVLSAPGTLARLVEQFGPERPFSAAQLAAYGNCPFAFFCERALELAEIEEPTEEVDAMLLGSLVHRCLARFFGRWGEHRQGRRIEEADLPAARQLMDGITDWAFEDARRRGLVADEVLFAITREDTRRDLHLLLGYEVSEIQAGGARPALFEQSFGMADRPSRLAIGEGDRTVLLRGRIDRLDLLPSEGGAPRFAVYDYKRSGGPSATAIERGQEFQLPVYALAARGLVLQDPLALCQDWAYYRTRRPQKLDCRPGRIGVEELIAAATRNALAHASAIRSGRFHPAPRDCAYCDYRNACRYEERRLAKKMPGGGDRDAGR